MCRYAESNLTLPDSTSFPKTLYFPSDYFVGMTPANLDIVNQFISNLTDAFGVVRQNINFTQLIFNQNATYSNSSNILTEGGNIFLLQKIVILLNLLDCRNSGQQNLAFLKLLVR